VDLTVAITPEGAGYRAAVRELPGCVVAATSLAELGSALDQAVRLWLGDPETTLLYLELRVGEVAATAVPGVLEPWWTTASGTN
jgi:predicted RNase H-like HicB family nuclease